MTRFTGSPELRCRHYLHPPYAPPRLRRYRHSGVKRRPDRSRARARHFWPLASILIVASACHLASPLNARADPLSASAGSAQTICSVGSATIGGSPTASGGSGGYSYSWSPNTGLSSPTVANPTASPITTTIYTVTVTDSSSSDAQSQVTVTVNPRPASFVSGNGAICNNNGLTHIQAALTGTGPWTVTWSDGFSHAVSTSPDSRFVSPSSTTTYTITALSDANCTAQSGDLTGGATVTVNPNPMVQVNSAAICSNFGPVTLRATVINSNLVGPVSYLWSPGGQGTQSIAVNPGTTTTYTVLVTTQPGCTNSASGTVTVSPRPTPVVSGCTTIPSGGSATIQAALNGPGPWSVTWSDGFSHSVSASPDSRTVSPTSTTTYTVTALTVANCSASPGNLTGSATITVVPNCPLTVLPNDNSTSGDAQAPSSRFRFARSVYLIKASELAGYASGVSPASIGWNYQTGGNGGSAPLKVYLQNTTDTSNTKSTTWSTAVGGMTLVHNATTTLPGASGPFDIIFSGGVHFTYRRGPLCRVRLGPVHRNAGHNGGGLVQRPWTGRRCPQRAEPDGGPHGPQREQLPPGDTPPHHPDRCGCLRHLLIG